MSAPIRVLIVVGQGVFADALMSCVADCPDLEVAGSAATSGMGLRLLEQCPCDVMVLDLSLGSGGSHDALVTIRDARHRKPGLGIVVTSGADPREHLLEAMHLGVRGWVPNTSTVGALVDAIRGVARGQTRIPAGLLAEALGGTTARGERATLEQDQDLRLADLTLREIEVLTCLVEGMSRIETGELLHMSPNTVRTHVQSILHKLDVHSALAAVAIARRAGIGRAHVRTS